MFFTAKYYKSFLKKLLLLFLFLLSVNTLKAGNEKSDSTKYTITAVYNQGITLFDRMNMYYLLNDYTKGAEIGLIRHRYQSDVWEKEFNNLDIGASLWFSTFGRKDILGEGIVLKAFADFHIFQLGNLYAKYHLSFGPAYVTKLFDIEKNLFNNTLSSRLNAYSGIGFNLNYLVTDRLSLTGNFLLHHISNGAFKKPNNGITLINIGLGIKYELNPLTIQPPVYQGKTPFKARELMGTIGIGVNQESMYYQKKFVSGSVSLTHLWYANKTMAYGFGMDFIHLGGSSFIDMDMDIDDEEINIINTFSNNLYLGLYSTMEIHLGRTSPYFTVGYYVYHKVPTITPIYGRLGFRQKIAGNLSAHFSIKIRFFYSEFMEFGLAYRWRYKY